MAHGARASPQGPLPRQARPGGRPSPGGAGCRNAHGPVLLGRLRLAVQRRPAEQPRRRHAGGSRHPRLRGVRHRPRARAHQPVRALGALERRVLARGRRPSRPVRRVLQRRTRWGHQRPLARAHAAPGRRERFPRAAGGPAGAALLVARARDRQVAHLPRHPPLRHPHSGIRDVRRGAAAEVGVHEGRGPLVRGQPQRAARGHRDRHRTGALIR